MVAQHLSSDRGADVTLDVLWRSTALRLPSRAVASLLVAGMTILAGSIFASGPLNLGALGIWMIAFAVYAAIIQSAVAHRSRRRVTRFLARLTSAIAAFAALSVGLLLLAAVFGGSIEVMRR